MSIGSILSCDHEPSLSDILSAIHVEYDPLTRQGKPFLSLAEFRERFYNKLIALRIKLWPQERQETQELLDTGMRFAPKVTDEEIQNRLAELERSELLTAISPSAKL
jgi:hypothetical protein